jgi:hypothetical protein
MLIHSLASDSGINLIPGGGETYFVRSCDVVGFLATCAESKVVVLGIEGFRKCGREIVPDLEFIADFSAVAELPPGQRSSASIEGSFLFFNAVKPPQDLLFDFTLSED